MTKMGHAFGLAGVTDDLWQLWMKAENRAAHVTSIQRLHPVDDKQQKTDDL